MYEGSGDLRINVVSMLMVKSDFVLNSGWDGMRVRWKGKLQPQPQLSSKPITRHYQFRRSSL
jgi:hypothetical protein